LELKLTFDCLNPDIWQDFEALFGEKGACGGCWCMYWRIPGKQYEMQKGEKNREEMKKIVESNEIPGILAYYDGKAVGWCAVAPRSAFSVLSRSRILKPIDDRPCWSIVCLFVEKKFRKIGVSVELIKAASDYAKKSGADLIEGYPLEPKPGKNIPPVFAWTGIPSAFTKAGFVEVARRSPTRPIMRKELLNN